MGAEFFEESFIRVMLCASDLEIDRVSRNEAELAIYDGGTDGARDGSEHVGGASLHENSAKD